MDSELAAELIEALRDFTAALADHSSALREHAEALRLENGEEPDATMD